MTEQKYGRIVNVTSVTGPLVSNVGSAAYGAAKAAMDGMMRAVRWRRHAMGSRSTAWLPGGLDGVFDGVRKIAALHTPLGRGHADEVAAAVCFLASPEASYIRAKS